MNSQEVLNLTLLTESIVKAYEKAVPAESDREIFPGTFLSSLSLGCQHTKVDVWKYFISGDPGIEFRKKILEAYKRHTPNERNPETIFSVVEKHECLKQFSCLLLVKLFDARVFKFYDPVDTTQRLQVLGNDVVQGYKKLKREQGHPIWNQRIALRSIKYFEFGILEANQEIYLDITDDEDNVNPVLYLKKDSREVYSELKMNFLKTEKDKLEIQRNELSNQVKAVTNKMQQTEKQYSSAIDEKNALVAVRDCAQSVKEFQENSTDVSVEQCFKKLRGFLDKCEVESVPDPKGKLIALVEEGIPLLFPLVSSDANEHNKHSTFAASEGTPEINSSDLMNSDAIKTQATDVPTKKSPVFLADAVGEYATLSPALEHQNKPGGLETSSASPKGSPKNIQDSDGDILQEVMRAAAITSVSPLKEREPDIKGIPESFEGAGDESDEEEDEDGITDNDGFNF